MISRNIPSGSYADGAPVGGAATTSVGPHAGDPFGVGVPGFEPGDSGNDDIKRPVVRGGAGGGSMVERVTGMATRIQQFEGPRGYSVRAGVAAKHVGWLLSLILCSAITHWAFADNPTWRFGGHVLFYSVTFMLAVAAVGSVLYADSRDQIYDQTRHFVFGIVLLPGTALALFMRLVGNALTTPEAQSDMFAGIIAGNGLPLVFFATVVIPPFVLAKYIFGGVRNINRQAMADEEQLAAMMRQDGYQR